MMFLGYPVLSYMAMPLAPIHAVTAIWLIVKGFPILLPNDNIKTGGGVGNGDLIL